MASINQIQRRFPNSKVYQRSTGTEIVLKDCPIDPSHDEYKCHINAEKEAVHCFVCHRPGEGISLNKIIRGKFRKRGSEISKKLERKVTPLPSRLTSLSDLPGSHPAIEYLNNRSMDIGLVSERGFRWKPEGVTAWEKDDKKIGRGLGGLVIPFFLNGDLKGWQLSVIPRIDGFPKYITAPGSKLRRYLYNFDFVKNSDVVVITEGVFDALRLPDIAVALLCDNINDGKKRLLSTAKFEEAILCLDDDRTDYHIEEQLGKLRGAARFSRAVCLDNGDPADYKESELRRLLGID